VPVAVVVADRRTGPEALVAREAGLVRRVHEAQAALVAEVVERAVGRDQEVEVPVRVGVEEDRRHPQALELDAGRRADVLERSVRAIAQERAAPALAVALRFHRPRRVDQEDVGPAVAVHVPQGHARAHVLRDAVRAHAGEVAPVEARLERDVGEAHARPIVRDLAPEGVHQPLRALARNVGRPAPRPQQHGRRAAQHDGADHQLAHQVSAAQEAQALETPDRRLVRNDVDRRARRRHDRHR
jgi:hypothetical protein